MTPKRLSLSVLAAALLVLAATVSLASGTGSAEAGAPRPVLLLIHGGGFVEGSPAAMDYAAAFAAREGEFATLQPAYPLNDLSAAFERLAGVALALGEQGRDVYAYGDSAGGAIAVWLASQGYVQASAAKAPATALVGWRSATARHYAAASASDRHSWRHLRATPRVRARYSTAYRRSLRPVRIYQSCADVIVPCSINIGFSRRDPKVSLERIWGPHKDPTAKTYSFEAGLDWLAEQAGVIARGIEAEA